MAYASMAGNRREAASAGPGLAGNRSGMPGGSTVHAASSRSTTSPGAARARVSKDSRRDPETNRTSGFMPGNVVRKTVTSSDVTVTRTVTTTVTRAVT